MHHNIQHQVIFLFRFMRLFQISFFSILRTDVDRIFAIVAWREDCHDGFPEPGDVQEIMWIMDSDESIDHALVLGELACSSGWISSDRLQINQIQAQRDLNWDAVKYSNALQKLLRIRVGMIDNGADGDAFMLHV